MLLFFSICVIVNQVFAINASNLHWPYNGWGIIGTDGLPDVNTSNNAEACPESHRFVCKRPQTDSSCDNRPDCCKKHYGCHIYGGHPAYHGETVDITIKTILQRAAGWVVNSFEYKDQNGIETCAEYDPDHPKCPYHGYISDCIGFLHMSWRRKFGKSSYYDHQIPIEKRISDFVSSVERGEEPLVRSIKCSECQPGDWISSGDHARLFRKWNGPLKPDGSRPWEIWQMGGGYGVANRQHGSWVPSKGYKCLRRGHIVNETSIRF